MALHTGQRAVIFEEDVNNLCVKFETHVDGQVLIAICHISQHLDHNIARVIVPLHELVQAVHHLDEDDG